MLTFAVIHKRVKMDELRMYRGWKHCRLGNTHTRSYIETKYLEEESFKKLSKTWIILI